MKAKSLLMEITPVTMYAVS